MKKLFYTAAILGAFALSSNAALAEGGMGGKKGGDDSYKGKMMERVDTNGDGMISKAEFMAKHEEKFAKMDADNDGMLTPDEMKAAKEKMKEKWGEMKQKRMHMQKDAE